MNIIGIVAEYNPFHLGHKYQINKIREMYPECVIIAVVSTHFTERGEISILNKWDKTTIALNEGIDLVVELPTLYATQSADNFANGALKILNSFNIDTLVFGSETDDIDFLTNLANIQINNREYNNLVKKYLDMGLNYPTSMNKALYEITGFNVSLPNDLLGLSYIKEIIKNNYNIKPVSIKRTNNYHGTSIDSNIINASLIRKLIHDGEDITKYIPTLTNKYIYKDLSLDNAYKFLVYNIINNRDKLDNFLDVDEGIEKRILKFIDTSNSWHELVMNIKTKRYTYNKINRMLIHVLLNIKKDDNDNSIYLRILGFNSTGRSYLNKIKKNIDIITDYKKNISRLLDSEYYTTYIYSIIINDLSLIDKEKNKPIIID